MSAPEVGIIRLYACALAEGAALARERYLETEAQLLAAGEAAEAALERCRQAAELAERYLVFAARAEDGLVNAGDIVVAAEAIKQLVGGRVAVEVPAEAAE